MHKSLSNFNLKFPFSDYSKNMKAVIFKGFIFCLSIISHEVMKSFAFPYNVWCLLNKFCQIARNNYVYSAMQNVQYSNLESY